MQVDGIIILPIIKTIKGHMLELYLKLMVFHIFLQCFRRKKQHEGYKENLTFFKMYGNANKRDYIGLIRFADMIPVPEKAIKQLDFRRLS